MMSPTIKPTPPIRGKLDADRRWEQGAWLFLVSLAVFFIACMILYATYIALRRSLAPNELQPFYLPPLFILSTIILVAVSTLLHLAVQAVRCERHGELLRYLVLSMALGFSFVLVQGLALAQLIWQMQKPGPTMANLYGLTFFLVVVHALHVIGGIAGMTFVLFGVVRRQYDHERNFPVRFCALYWHFLDGVWVVMLVAFAVAAVMSK